MKKLFPSLLLLEGCVSLTILYTSDPRGFVIATKTPPIDFRCQKATTKPIINTRKTIAEEMTELERETCSESMNLLSSSEDVSKWINKADKKVSVGDTMCVVTQNANVQSTNNEDLDLDFYLPFFVNNVPEAKPVGWNHWLSITFEAAERRVTC